MDKLIDGVVALWDDIVLRAQHAWRGATLKQKLTLALGIGFSAGSAFVGGIVGQAVFAAFIINAFGWLLMSDSESCWWFIKRYGVKVDMLVTVLGFMFSPVPGATGAFTAIMLGVYFSIFRSFLAPVDAKLVAEAEAKKAARIAARAAKKAARENVLEGEFVPA